MNSHVPFNQPLNGLFEALSECGRVDVRNMCSLSFLVLLICKSWSSCVFSF